MVRSSCLARQILSQTYLMSLATVRDNNPWVADVVFVHDDIFNIYWISRTDTKHSMNIAICSQVAATITQSTDQGEDNVGLQIAGNAFQCKGSLTLVKKHLTKRKKLTAENVRQFLSPGVSWYKLVPSRIELIYEPMWGYDKQLVSIN